MFSFVIQTDSLFKLFTHLLIAEVFGLGSMKLPCNVFYFI